MADEVSLFLREHDICNDVDFYSIVREYVFGRRANEGTARDRSFIKDVYFLQAIIFSTII